jgi:hypothetical protein
VTFATDSKDDVEALPPAFGHGEYCFRRVLEVGVHDDHGAPGGEIQACRDRHLVTEVPG